MTGGEILLLIILVLAIRHNWSPDLPQVHPPCPLCGAVPWGTKHECAGYQEETRESIRLSPMQIRWRQL